MLTTGQRFVIIGVSRNKLETGDYLRLSKSGIIALLVFAGLIAAGYIEIVVLALPWFAPIISYAAFVAAMLYLSRARIAATRGALAYNRGEEGRAAALFDSAIALGSKQASPYIGRATIALRHGDNELALSVCRRCMALKLDSYGDKNARITLAACKWTSGDIDGAIEDLEKLRNDYEYVNANVLTTLGYLYITKRELSKARELTKAALEDNPDHYSAYDNMGQIYFCEGDTQNAESAFKKALEIKSDYVDSLYFMGLICEGRDDTKNAAMYFKGAKAAKITPMNAVSPADVESKYQQYKDYQEIL